MDRVQKVVAESHRYDYLTKTYPDVLMSWLASEDHQTLQQQLVGARIIDFEEEKQQKQQSIFVFIE